MLRRIYGLMESASVLAGPLRRYRQRYYRALSQISRRDLVHGRWRSLCAALIALLYLSEAARLALHLFSSLRNRISVTLRSRLLASVPAPPFRQAVDAPTSPKLAPSLFPIALDHHLENVEDLPALLEPGARRAAFEIYRNALFVGMIAAISDTNADYQLTMELSDNPLKEVISRFSKHSPLKAEHERLLRLAIALNPAMSEAHYSLGKKLATDGNIAEACKHFLAAHEGRETVIPDHGDPGPRAKANFELGRYYLNQGQVNEAITAFELAISLAHANNRAIFPASAELATALRKAGRYEEAADRYLESLNNSVIMPTLPSLPSILSAPENCCA